MLDVRELSLDFGQKVLFHEVNLTLLPGLRYGVTGANGAGKSTFLRVLAGEETPNAGSIEKAKSTSIGILKQDHFRYEHDRVIDVVLKGDASLWAALIEKEELLQKIDWSEA